MCFPIPPKPKRLKEFIASHCFPPFFRFGFQFSAPEVLLVMGGAGGKGLGAFKQFRPSLEEVAAEPLTLAAKMVPESTSVKAERVANGGAGEEGGWGRG